jgi:hypothetical protein
MRVEARRPRGEEGSVLVLAIVFFTAIALMVSSLLVLAQTNLQAAGAVRTARGADYDADAAVEAAIARIRVDRNEGYLQRCLLGGYVPTWTLNNPARPIRVDCFPSAGAPLQRRVVLSVCPRSMTAPCPDEDSLLRADVEFADDVTFGRAVVIHTWSQR